MVSYRYDPQDPPVFQRGLCCNFGGSLYQTPTGQRTDVVHTFTPLATQDTIVKGKMRCKLTVSSDCEDTCFYARISIVKPEGDLGLRDDITSLCYQLGDYVPNSKVALDFTFDDISFLLKQGERLRLDIASADGAHYVRHTNQKGLYSTIKTTKIATNTVYLSESTLSLPISREDLSMRGEQRKDC